MNREAIMDALLSRVGAVQGIVTASRDFRVYDDLEGVEMPALFQRQVSDSYTRKARGLPAIVTMHAELWIYARSNRVNGQVASSVLNPILDAIDAALAPTAAGITDGVQTLGGAVSHAWIEGTV